MNDNHSSISQTQPLTPEEAQEFRRLKFAISSSEDGIWEFNVQNNTTYVSKRWLEIIGYDENEYESSIEAWKDLLHPDDVEQAMGVLFNSIANKIESAHVRYRVRHKDGHWIWIHDRAKILFDEAGEPLIVAGFRTDVTELVTAQEQLLYLATHDSLTALPNRTLFLDHLQNTLKKNYFSDEKIAVLFIDLDHFKQINDSLGHPVGDKLLVLASQRLKSILRESDTIARMGGDEFNILIGSINHVDDLIDICEKLIHAFREPFAIDGRLLHTSLSIGIALSPDDGMSAETLLKNADTAMYRAKNEGRNTYRFYANEMGDKAFERVVMENALRIALKENQLQVYYQPQVDLVNGELIGLEALVRWMHPTIGMVSPINFIPLCEEMGLISEVDFFVLESVANQQVKWHNQGINAPKVAVNFSAKTLGNPLIAKEVASILNFYGCVHEWIAIEVTESHIMKNPEEVIYILKELKDLGLEISIDDFGTGYSSLSYLKRLPIHKLKIDQSFIREIPYDEDDIAITKTIIGLAHNLKLDVIAEGVETAEQQTFLLENGCQLAQGYLFSKPLDTEAVTGVLRNL
ncbi:putative bifunctional diguanylate cyclase/phosphodiesterase [Sulfuricurvum sp.]|uniref:putative bifunctional diguanylate cyclase/phosphodiesterase n=1 Tax=Sulfuricurvum sp. TaxID=2025608 RepID=UPI002E33197B|nr:EAL domain-containing protein [Sulfuricurvum sp.]HEX5329803.1 EAL domain-containing protein [Sulfuricurvum sp.]